MQEGVKWEVNWFFATLCRSGLFWTVLWVFRFPNAAQSFTSPPPFLLIHHHCYHYHCVANIILYFLGDSLLATMWFCLWYLAYKNVFFFFIGGISLHAIISFYNILLFLLYLCAFYCILCFHPLSPSHSYIFLCGWILCVYYLGVL